MKQYLDIFRSITKKRKSELRALGLASEVKMSDSGTAVLKLQKETWSDGGFRQGVFFSIWIEPKDEKKKIAKYNTTY